MFLKKVASGVLLVTMASIAPWSLAQDGNRAIAVKPGSHSPQAIEARVALVIGNGAYADAPLRNPVNDARAMRDALASCKFEVTHLTDASKRAMEDAIRAFGDRLQGGAVGLFYFAGHGLQVQGSNFLIPIGARLDKETDVAYEGVDVGRVLDNMQAAGNKLNILVLDACRNNPYALAKGWRSLGEKGLAQVKAPTGTLVAYATAPGSTAADGSGEHGLYTEALLEEIQKPGLKLEEVFKRVREKVLDGSNNSQTPWESNSTVGDFYFHPLSNNLIGPSEQQLEATYWEGIQDSNDSKEFDAYLARFPNGIHAELATFKLKALRSYVRSLVGSNISSHAAESPAISELLAKAKQGNADAQVRLGLDYSLGQGVAQDYIEAVKWLRKAAEQGNPIGQWGLGSAYSLGQGVQKDNSKAVMWFRKAAFQGNVSAQHMLGLHYSLGWGVKMDQAEALRWFRKAADQGNADSQFRIGYGYAYGEGTYKDTTEAVKWYRKAADQGYGKAQAQLGGCYSLGQGVPQDNIEAVKWLRQAAEQGISMGQLMLGYHYANGLGIQQNTIDAYIWFSLAAAQGETQATTYRDQVANKLSQPELEQAQERARKVGEEIEAKSNKSNDVP